MVNGMGVHGKDNFLYQRVESFRLAVVENGLDDDFTTH
jgi:hypothetical protein